jgi:hypothetical protein
MMNGASHALSEKTMRASRHDAVALAVGAEEVLVAADTSQLLVDPKNYL